MGCGVSISVQEVVVSVIVPTYCEEEHVEKCLLSVKRQEFSKGKVEVIVVDSNSPDDTRAIAEKYADKVINIKERGVGKARNVGAREARGEILLFLDADTVLDQGFLSAIYESFSDPRVVCVSGSVGGLERLGVLGDFFKHFHYGLMNKFASFTARLGFPFFPTVCCACRKSAFEKIGGFEEDIAVGEDLVFSRRMGKIGQCMVCKKAKAYTSLRRVEKNGALRNYFIYFRNYYRVFFSKQKPWINEFPHTREI